LITGTLLIAAGSLGCDNAAENTTEGLGVRQSASVTTAQIPLSGNSVAKFVDPLPTFNGRRSDGTTTQHVAMQEFQQKVLPNSFYTALRAPFNNGTYLWGYNINGAGPSFPARTIERARTSRRRPSTPTGSSTRSFSNY